MEDEFQTFNLDGKSVRVVIKNGRLWFVAKDVCDALGLVNSRMALNALDNDEKDTQKVMTSGGRQKMNIISESGFYLLIMRSDKPDARRYRKRLIESCLRLT